MLDPADFPSWEFRMKAYLMSHGIWGSIDGVSDNWGALSAADMTVMLASTFVTISHSLGPMHEYIAREFSPDQPLSLWNRLKAMFHKTTTHTQLVLSKKWANLAWRPEHTVDSFLAEIAQLRAQHKSAGFPIADNIAFVKILSALPSTFDTETSMMEDWPLPEMDRMRELLLKRENATRKRKFDEANTPIMEVASYAMPSHAGSSAQPQNNGNGPNKKRKKTCYYCAKEGHIRPNCKQKIDDEKRGIFRKNTKKSIGSVHVASSSVVIPDSIPPPPVHSSSRAVEFTSSTHVNSSKSDGKEEENTFSDDDFGLIFMMSSNVNVDSWILDSGSTHHLCNNASFMRNASSCNAHIRTGKAQANIDVSDMGLVVFSPVVSGFETLSLSGVLMSPEFSSNIISVPQLIKRGCNVLFEGNRAIITFKGKTLCEGEQDPKSLLYILKTHQAKCSFEGVANTMRTSVEQMRILHNRLGHLNHADIIRMSKDNLASGLPPIHGYPDKFECTHCLAGKGTRKAYPKVSHPKEEPADVCDEIHSDTFGPIKPVSRYNHSYAIFFIDRGSHFAFVIGLTSLDQVHVAYVKVRNIISTQLNRKIKKFVCDGYSTYVSTQMSKTLEDDGTLLKVRSPYCPEQNGLAERRGRTSIEMARTLMAQSGVPANCWEDALSHGNYVRNRVPTRALPGITPFEKFWGRKPDLQYLRPFGCLAIALIHDAERSAKFDAVTLPGVFLGFSDKHSAYKILVLADRSIKISRDVQCYENVFPYRRNPAINLQELNPIKYGPAHDDMESLQNDPFHDFSEQTHHVAAPEPIAGDETYQVHKAAGVDLDADSDFNFTNLIEGWALSAMDVGTPEDVVIPKSVKEAMAGPKRDKWMESLRTEYNAMVKHNTFAPLSDIARELHAKGELKVHGTRVVFTVKRNDRGEIARFKARLVVQGFTMQDGIDYDSTFSPVARLNSVRMLAALACAHNLEMLHTDVPNAYLNGKTTKLVLVRLPELWNTMIGPDLGPDGSPVIMVGSVYGTPDAGRNWNTCIHEFFIAEGYLQCSKEPCLYTKGKLPEGTLIGMWVDDNYIVSGDTIERARLLNEMERKFSVKNLGQISFSLGIHFTWSDAGLYMTQTAYVGKIVEKFRMEECHPLYVPMQKGMKPTAKMSPQSEEEKAKMSDVPYKSAIGSLLYLAICTRPDIIYAVSALARYSQNPGMEHWMLVKHVIRYVRFTKGHGLFYKRHAGVIKELTSEGFADAAYNDSECARSTTGYIVVLLGLYSISWRSKLTTLTALSTMESELVALHSLVREVAWMRLVLREISSLSLPPTTIHCDNNPVVQQTRQPRVTEKNKHINPKFFYVLDLIRDNSVIVVKIGTDDQIADILTKSLANPRFAKMRSSLGVRSQEVE